MWRSFFFFDWNTFEIVAKIVLTKNLQKKIWSLEQFIQTVKGQNHFWKKNIF